MIEPNQTPEPVSDYEDDLLDAIDDGFEPVHFSDMVRGVKTNRPAQAHPWRFPFDPKQQPIKT